MPFEGIIRYERVITKLPKNKSRIIDIIIFIKNSWIKIQYTNTKKDIQTEMIFNPIQNICYEINHEKKEVIYEFSPSHRFNHTIYKEHFLTEKEIDTYLCLGYQTQEKHDFFIKSLKLNTVALNNLIISIEKDSSLYSIPLYWSKRTRDFGTHTTETTTKHLETKCKKLEIDNFQLSINMFKEYDIKSLENKHEENSIACLFSENEARKILEKQFSRELSNTETKYPFKYLNFFFKVKPSLKDELLKEQKEKREAFTKKIEKSMINILQDYWKRPLTKDETENVITIFAEIQKENIELGLQLLRML